jgi:deoxycytidylate deaminase
MLLLIFILYLMSDEQINLLLLREASKSYINHKISCVITYHGNVIATGYNRGLVHSSLNKCCPLRG